MRNSAGIVDNWRGIATSYADIYSVTDAYGTYAGARDYLWSAESGAGMFDAPLMAMNQTIQIPPIPPGGVYAPVLTFSWILQKTSGTVIASAYAFATLVKVSTGTAITTTFTGATKTSPAANTRFDESFDLTTFMAADTDFREYDVTLAIWAVWGSGGPSDTVNGVIVKPEFVV